MNVEERKKIRMPCLRVCFNIFTFFRFRFIFFILLTTKRQHFFEAVGNRTERADIAARDVAK
jgi:hypothetical protein